MSIWAMKSFYPAVKTSLLFLFLQSALNLAAQYPEGSPAAMNGRLKVSGTRLVSECGNPVQLRGMSSHGLHWFPQCYTASSLDALVNDWKIDVFRLAMYVQEQGYVTNPAYWKSYIDGMVDACGKRGIYCIIDWHVLNPGDPNVNITEARDFWTYMSARHGSKKHVLYEICNEPNGVSWSTVKNYANDIIPRIRTNDSSTVIIVGTPTWSQDVDVAAADMLSFPNLMYALHFYSGTHGQPYRDRASTAISRGAAIFVTEFGTSQSSSMGGPYLTEAENWMSWMTSNGISWCNWSFCDKAEVSSALNSGSCAGGNWNSTSSSGAWVKEKLTSGDNFTDCGTNIVYKLPEISITTPANNAVLTAPVSSIVLNAVVFDTNGIVVKVEFYNGTTLLGSDDNPPYSYTWSDIQPGTYSVTAMVIDYNGGVNVSSVVVLVVNQPPVISITAPASGAVFQKQENINLVADASDVDGSIQKVEFYDGATYLGVVNSSPYSFVWNGASPGVHTITAVATDNNNARDTSGIRTLNITESTTIIPNAPAYGYPGNLYPNPSNASFTLTSGEEIQRLFILNMFGAQVGFKEHIPGGYNMELGEELDYGTYVLQVQYVSGKMEIYKMIKIH